MTHHFMLFFDFFKPDDYEPMEQPDNELFRMKKDSYTFRVVYGLNRLKEKIIILEKGLNDVAIEHQKYMITHVICPELAEKGYEIYFDHTEEPTEEFPNGTIFFVYEDTEAGNMMQVRFAMDSYFEHCKSCETDPRMAVKDITCIDEGWIGRRLKEE